MSRTRAFEKALRAARELFAAGFTEEAIAIWVQLAAAVAASPALRASLLPSVASALQAFAPAAARFLKTTRATRYVGDTLRAVTAASAAPATTIFDRYARGGLSPRVTFGRLQDEGFSLLERGHAQGLTLVGASLRYGEATLPYERLESAIVRLPERRTAQTHLTEARVLAQTAYALAPTDMESAVRIGSLAPALGVGGSGRHELVNMWRDLHAQPVAHSRTSEAARSAALGTGIVLLEKGYPAEATQLQLDSMRLEPGDWRNMWAGVERGIRSTSPYMVYTAGAGGGTTTSEATSAQPPQFYFILEGEKVDHDQVVYGADFDLVFNYDVPPDSALAVVHGEKLVPQGKIQIVIFLSGGLELRDDGSTSGVAEFENGKLKAPVRFLLKAPAIDQGQAHIDVIFSVKGARIYELPLYPRLVTEIDKTNNPQQPLDVDLDELTAEDRAQRNAELYIDDKDGGFLATFVYKSKGEPAKVVSDFNTAQLDTEMGIIRELLKDVAGHAIWNNIGSKLEPPSHKAELRKQMDKVLEAGWRLYNLFLNSQFKDVITRINDLDDGATVSITAKTAFMPFELLYPLQYDHNWGETVPLRAANFRPEKLWGYRFQLETLPMIARQGKMPRPQQKPPVSISMAVGKTVEDEESGKEAVGWQRTYFDTKITKFGRFLTDRKDIEPIFTTTDVATFIYLLCHGQNKDAAQKADAVLEFEKDFLVTPNTLIAEPPYAGQPIVFLNSCSSGAISPLSFVSFLKEFRKKGAVGLIATSSAIPTRFAVAFGEKLLDGYLDQQPIGKVLLNARRPLLKDHVPLGLFYTLQCPLDVLGPAKVTT